MDGLITLLNATFVTVPITPAIASLKFIKPDDEEKLVGIAPDIYVNSPT